MKALALVQYGKPSSRTLKIIELPVPIPKEGQVLIRVRAAGINAADGHLLSGAVPRLMGFGLFRPRNKILGSDVAGVVEMLGPGASRWKPGDRVYGDLSGAGHGGFGEFVCVHESKLAAMPNRGSFAEAASLPMAAVTALQALRDRGKLGPGARVLINGASGGVGYYAVQIALAMGAEVTAVASTSKLPDLVSLGVTKVVDYTTTDFTKEGGTYDLVLGVNGYRPLQDYKKVLAPRGIYVMVGGDGRQIFQALALGGFYSSKNGQQFLSLMAEPRVKDLETITAMVEAGTLKPRVWKTLPLEQGIEGLELCKSGHAGGKIVITMGDGSEHDK